MEVHIVYFDSFITDYLLLDALEENYKLLPISIDDLIRDILQKNTQESINLKEYLNNNQMLPDNIYNELIISEIKNNYAKNLLIIKYPKSKEQWSLLKYELDKINYIINKIWYFQEINVLENLLKIEKYRIEATKVDLSLSHIKQKIFKYKAINWQRIDFLNLPNKTKVIEVEAFAEDGINSAKNIARKIREGKYT